ncbi:hypothetical protein MC378_10790 [Polaribacter sp. MSW13]|uniref:Uncharacterized protein n=1 Tax=Polaribacter marinus TaxID=2916838 RepID=A0A9X1VNW4_9FLAO|nr:hypothetical protein [Polaribacter marinus]MCI2229652.1 hypothetical protein [Polaribacter marinus]
MQSNNIYKNDSENQIIQKRSLEELNMWISQVNYILEESNTLAKIASDKLKNKDLRDQFLMIIEKNAGILSAFLTYKNTTDNFMECIDLDCDLFYYNEHEKIRNLYTEYLNNYRSVKKKFFKSLLIHN